MAGEEPQNVEVGPVGGSSSLLEVRNKKPGRHYRWVRAKGPMADSNLDKKAMQGYTPEKATSGPGVRQDSSGNRQAGDLVLMSCPEEEFQRREKERIEKEKRRVRATDEAFKERMEEMSHPAGRKAADIVINEAKK